jgi:hypothetical protein
MLSLEPSAGFIAALAVKGHGWRPHFWQWSEQPICSLAHQEKPKWFSVNNEETPTSKPMHIPGPLCV